jgi:hypothetical protein
VTKKTVKQGGCNISYGTNETKKCHRYIYIEKSFKELGLQTKTAERKIIQIFYLSS